MSSRGSAPWDCANLRKLMMKAKPEKVTADDLYSILAISLAVFMTRKIRQAQNASVSEVGDPFHPSNK